MGINKMGRNAYTVKRFIEIAQRETRRGRDLAQLVPAVSPVVNDLKYLRETHQKNLSATNDTKQRALLQEKYLEERLELRGKRDQTLSSELLSALVHFENKLTDSEYSFSLTKAPKIDDRQTYRMDSAAEVLFPAKAAASVINNYRYAANPSRNSIVRALKENLKRGYQHAIYRIDVSDFYDSIPHSKLRMHLKAQKNTDKITFHLVDQLLNEYSALQNSGTGVPPGIGLSSALAEFYLRDFDRWMKTRPGVLFYARYVDDIIFVLEKERTLPRIIKEVNRQLSLLGLDINTSKTQAVCTDNQGNYQANEILEYLGYQFRRVDGNLKTGLSSKRFSRRLARLRKAFEVWEKSSQVHRKPTTENTDRDGLLVDRVRYLAGNLKLVNSKNNVAVGLYFSNSALDDDAHELTTFDTALQSHINAFSHHMSGTLQKRLRTISFTEMFQERPFLRFTQHRIERIVQCWKGEKIE